MEVIPLIRSSATGSESSKGDNGIKRHVQEWSRMDRLTGILEHARVEADQWTNHTANTKHKYGKVVDRRARNLADGSKEETQQTKQLEVFQTHTAGCSVQVIRSQTSTTSSWHNSSAGSTAFQWPPSIFDKKDNHFDQLRLEHSPLDVSSQKNKASVARSGSISTRRPPTRRPQAVTSQLPKTESVDSAVADATDTTAASDTRESADESIPSNLNRLKSCSNDEIRSDVCTAESDEPLDRSSRFRRSLQFAQSRQVDGSSVRAVTGELENVLKKVLGKKQHAVNGDAAVDEGSLIRPAASPKKPSFITVESLNKTKNSLRHLQQDEDAARRDHRDDDGIETDTKTVGDSRSLDYRSTALTRTEEWYNRRKSYGFEKVSTADRNKERSAGPSAMDSSTDSGICRSTENGLSNSSRQSSVDRESIADLVKKYSAKEINNNTLQAHAYNTTVVAKGKILEAINSLRSKSSAYFDVVKPNDVVLASKENEEREREQVFTRRLSVGVDMVMDKNSDKDDIPKRHSIAVVSEAADPNVDKKNASKKVEFCRTEVHFDTTPGKINIVDMEDKPAPAQLYRPKKRYNRPPEKNHGLPEYRFGDDVAQQQHPHEVVASQTNGDDESRAETPPPTAEDDGAAAEDSDRNKPRSILKRQQQQQQNGGDNTSGGMASDNGIEVRISSTESTPVDCRRASWSVADRIRQVEAVGFSTRVNFTEGGETTAVGFDPADPKKYRYSYNGTASPVWYQNNGNDPSAATAAATDASAAAKCHEKLLVRIGACGNGGAKANATDRPCAFSECFGGTASEPVHRLSSTSLVLRNTTRQPCSGTTTFPEGTNARTQGRFRKTPSTSWPRCGHKTYPAAASCASTAARKHDPQLKSRRADVRERKAPVTGSGDMPDVIVALDDLSKTIEEQIVRDQHVTLIKVRQSPTADQVLRSVRGRLEYVKDLMSTDETSEESLKADEEVRSYMMAAATDDDDDDDDDRANEDDNHLHKQSQHRPSSECENLKKLISTVKKNIKRSQCSQENRTNKSDGKSNESSLTIPPPPNVTSVLLNHEKPSEPERSQFQPVSVHTAQVTHVVKHVVKHQFEDVQQKQASKRVPVKIVQDNRKTKQKNEISKTEVPPVTKMCATVSLKQVPMTVQPRLVGGDKKKIISEKKESTACSNVGGHRSLHNVIRAKDKPATVTAACASANKQAQQDLFSTGRDSWLNMPRDLGPKLNRSKGTAAAAHGCKSGRPGRKELAAAESEVSVLEELNRAADEILKAVNGYTDDESLHPNDEPKTRSDGSATRSEAKLKNRKKAARLLQRANSREALLHLDEASSSDEEIAVDDLAHCRPAKPKAQRKVGRPTAANSVANKTTASFTKKIQSRAQNATTSNVQHKIHPTCYGNVSNYTPSGPIKLRNKPSNTVAKQLVDQKDSKAGRYQCKITSRTFGSKKSKGAVEENKNSIKGC